MIQLLLYIKTSIPVVAFIRVLFKKRFIFLYFNMMFTTISSSSSVDTVLQSRSINGIGTFVLE